MSTHQSDSLCKCLEKNRQQSVNDSLFYQHLPTQYKGMTWKVYQIYETWKKKQLITSSPTAAIVHFSSIIWCSSKINITVNVNLWNDIHHVVQIVIQIKKILALLFASSVHNTISQDEIENWIIEFFLNYTKLV